MMIKRVRKSKFVRLFDKTPKEVVCPHFYELILSNGCPYDCTYCYLKLTFRGNSRPTLFTNKWKQVQQELENIPQGVFSTGELADSLAVTPPLLEPALQYFRSQKSRYLLLLTKSTNIKILRNNSATKGVIASFSVNSTPAAKNYEIGAPDPLHRIEAAQELNRLGWRVRIRIDPIIVEAGIDSYKTICQKIAELKAEVVTIGTLRQYPGLFRFA
jgi:spore photoproduct lyase